MEVININVAINCWFIFWITYWISGSFVSWMTHKYEIRKVTEFKEVVFCLLTNMFWTLLGLLFVTFIPFRGLTDSHIVVKLVLNYFFMDIWFYHLHLLMHHPQLYTNLHKLHHKFKTPYALTALYCTGYESIFLNVFSTSLGCVILQIPPLFLYIWFFLVSLNSVLTHSGLKFSFLIDGTHDDHHKFFNYNYGISGYIDMIYGTCLPNISNQKEKEEVKEKEVKEKTHLGNFKIDELKL